MSYIHNNPNLVVCWTISPIVRHTSEKKTPHNWHWRPGQDCLLHSVPDASTWAPHHQLHHGPSMWIFFTRFWVAFHRVSDEFGISFTISTALTELRKNNICSMLRCFREWEGKKVNIIHWTTDEMKKNNVIHMRQNSHGGIHLRNPHLMPGIKVSNHSIKHDLKTIIRLPRDSASNTKKSTATSYQLPIHQSTVVSWGPVVFFVGWLFWLNGPRKNSADLLSRFH